MAFPNCISLHFYRPCASTQFKNNYPNVSLEHIFQKPFVCVGDLFNEQQRKQGDLITTKTVVKGEALAAAAVRMQMTSVSTLPMVNHTTLSRMDHSCPCVSLVT